MDKKCGNCVFWNKENYVVKTTPIGECRRYPPKPVGEGEQAMWECPETNVNFSCGEWGPKSGIDVES